MEYRADIDGLRAVAVTVVVLFHAAPGLLPGGFVGVDIFFVISGYLITSLLWSQLEDGSFHLITFYARRARRLFPALYVTIAVTLLIAGTLFPVDETRSAAFSAASAIASVSNIQFALQSGYFDDDSYQKPLLHTWSLSVEEQFYLAWPFLLGILYRRRASIPKFLALPSILVLVLLSEASVHLWPLLAYFLVPFRAFQFLTGSVLHLVPIPQSYIAHTVLSAPGWLALWLSLYTFSGSTPFPGFSASIPTVGAALILATPRSYLSGFLTCPPLPSLGRISYSVYLVHWPLLVSHRLLSGRRTVEEETALLVVLSFLLGFALYHTVEVRYRSYSGEKKKGGSDSETVLTYATLGLLLCIVAGCTLLISHHRAERGKRRALLRSVPQRDEIPGINATTLQYWVRRTGYRHDKGRTLASVRDGRSYHYTYRPAGAQPSARLLLIGDSHALNMRNALLRVAIEKQFHYEALSRGACVPLLALPELDPDGVESAFRTRACANEQNLWRKRFEETPYDFVVIVSRFMNMFEGSSYGEHSMRLSTTLDDPGVPRRPAMERRKRFERALRDTVAIVRRSGASVILFSQWPHLGRTVRGCMQLPGAQAELAHRAQPRQCLGVTRRVALRRASFMDGLLKKLAHEDQHVAAVVSSSFFCDNWEDTHCRSVYSAKELYDDQNHLSEFGAMFLAQRWAQNAYNGVDWSFRNARVTNRTK